MNQAQHDHANFVARECDGVDRENESSPSRFWISWWQPGDDPRPLHYPPKDQRVLGWWRSGSDDTRTSICALIAASDEATAKAAVLTDWPESATAQWRFAEAKDESYWTPGDRFPLSDWMRPRIDGVPGMSAGVRAGSSAEPQSRNEGAQHGLATDRDCTEGRNADLALERSEPRSNHRAVAGRGATEIREARPGAWDVGTESAHQRPAEQLPVPSASSRDPLDAAATAPAALDIPPRVAAAQRVDTRPRTIYDHRARVDEACRDAAPLLYHALKRLLEAVRERPDTGIETTVFADADRALAKAAPYALGVREDGNG